MEIYAEMYFQMTDVFIQSTDMCNIRERSPIYSIKHLSTWKSFNEKRCELYYDHIDGLMLISFIGFVFCGASGIHATYKILVLKDRTLTIWNVFIIFSGSENINLTAKSNKNFYYGGTNVWKNSWTKIVVCSVHEIPSRLLIVHIPAIYPMLSLNISSFSPSTLLSVCLCFFFFFVSSFARQYRWAVRVQHTNRMMDTDTRIRRRSKEMTWNRSEAAINAIAHSVQWPYSYRNGMHAANWG